MGFELWGGGFLFSMLVERREAGGARSQKENRSQRVGQKYVDYTKIPLSSALESQAMNNDRSLIPR